MDSLLNEFSDPDGRHSSPLKSTDTTMLTSETIPNREHSAQEEKLSKVLIERVLPPFSKSMKVQALVVYQADQEKMNCLLVNRTFEKQPGPVSGFLKAALLQRSDGAEEEETSDLSDSGYLESTNAVPDGSPEPMNGVAESYASSESVDPNQSISRRKRKLCRPCKIPQNGLPVAPDLVTTSLSSSAEVDVKVSKFTTNTPFTTVIQQSSTPVASTNEMIPFTAKSISESVLLPVTAVTLLPRVSVFSLPVTVLSTLPRPILPRLAGNSHDKLPMSVITNSGQSTSVVFAATTGSITVTAPQTTIRTTDAPAKSEPSRMPVVNIPVGDPANSALNRRFSKSFLCNQCRRDFASLSQLCAHTFAVHRSFRCTICGAQFTQRSNLQRHSLRHVGFKPFICKVCDKAYYRKDHLVRHIEISHPGRDPRLSLTVKLSSAECLDYLERLQSDRNDTTTSSEKQIPDNGSPEVEEDGAEPAEENA